MYVQERLTERADELRARAGGAHLYLCGLKGMQPGIEAALEQAAVARGLDFKTADQGAARRNGARGGEAALAHTRLCKNSTKKADCQDHRD